MGATVWLQARPSREYQEKAKQASVIDVCSRKLIYAIFTVFEPADPYITL